MEVVLQTVSLVSVRILPSAEVVSSIVSPVVSSGWCPVPIYVHWNWGVVHPTGGIGRIVLWCALSLRAVVVPLRTRLLGSEGSEVSVPSEYISEQYFRSNTGKGLLGVFLVGDRRRVAHDVFGYVSW